MEYRAGRGPHQPFENAEAADVWPRAPGSLGPPLPADPTRARGPGRWATDAGPGPGRRAGRLAHAHPASGASSCLLASRRGAGHGRGRPRRHSPRPCGVTVACRTRLASSTGWTSAAYGISLSTITKSGKEPIFSGRERARTLGAVRRRFPPSRRHNIWRESVARAVKCPISWRPIDSVPHRTNRLYEDAPSYVTTLFELADCIY